MVEVASVKRLWLPQEAMLGEAGERHDLKPGKLTWGRLLVSACFLPWGGGCAERTLPNTQIPDVLKTATPGRAEHARAFPAVLRVQLWTVWVQWDWRGPPVSAKPTRSREFRHIFPKEPGKRLTWKPGKHRQSGLGMEGDGSSMWLTVYRRGQKPPGVGRGGDCPVSGDHQ